MMEPNALATAASELALAPADLDLFGPGIAKIKPAVAFAEEPTKARLVLVSAMSPTPAGNGKTTVSIGLTQAARRRGLRAVCALRQPSLGPIFGKKGGATGGGRSSLVPADRINIHCTGDLHAVGAAHNLLAALVDNAIYYPGAVDLDSRQISWRRVIDMNDRFLRHTVIGLGGKAMGVPREDGFDITAASEVMAILCLARDYVELKQRLGDIVVGAGRDGRPVRARELGAAGPMAALLRDALLPNLVTTTEGAPALLHGGPFGNIAHGCSSVVATRLAMRRAEVVFTEAGFGFDLGGEKFLDIKCRQAGVWPDAVVLVATLRALRFHGGASEQNAGRADREALLRGLGNLEKHIENVRRYGLAPVVALNVYAGDAESELAEVVASLRKSGVPAAAIDIFGRGGAGADELMELLFARPAAERAQPRFLYPLDLAPAEKIETLAREIYGARTVSFSPTARQQLERLVGLGFGGLPICMAKTHLSFSDDPSQIGRPRDFEFTIRELRVAAGAGFLIPISGEILTMPGLPRAPHAAAIDLLPDGTIVGVS